MSYWDALRIAALLGGGFAFVAGAGAVWFWLLEKAENDEGWGMAGLFLYIIVGLSFLIWFGSNIGTWLGRA